MSLTALFAVTVESVSPSTTVAPLNASVTMDTQEYRAVSSDTQYYFEIKHCWRRIRQEASAYKSCKGLLPFHESNQS